MGKVTKELTVPATQENMDSVIGFTEDVLNEVGCPMKVIMQIELCVEEVYVNVASYAYRDQTGNCSVRIEAEGTEAGGYVSIQVIDGGVRFNPLEKADPDITLSADEREIGGLGIYMVKKSMDRVTYQYLDKNNILCLEKSWQYDKI